MTTKPKEKKTEKYPLEKPKSEPRISAIDRGRADVSRAIDAAKRGGMSSWDSIVYNILGSESTRTKSATTDDD